MFPSHDQRGDLVFRIFGYAGTGKTTIAKHVVGEHFKESEVVYCTFTGKAALVMKKHGMDATTAHSLIYTYVPPDKKVFIETEKKLEKIGAGEGDPEWGTEAELQKLLKDCQQPRFKLNTESELAGAKLCGVDEVSMVNEPLAKDLLSFGVPLLVLGDPGQLPPVEGTGYLTQGMVPNVMLDKIHRQAEGNPIIDFATRARQGKPIPFSQEKGSSARNLRLVQCKDELEEIFCNAGQILCGKNKTRLKLNAMMRASLGRSGLYPTPEDKLICLKNNKELGLFNGLFVTMEKIHEDMGDYLIADLKTETGIEVPRARVLTAFFNEYEAEGTVKALNHWDRKDRVELDFGYAITVHKSQGSQWDNVVLYDDGMFAWSSAKEARKQWLYTAITRAAENVTLIRT
jgi:exodeoxyribonuclease-5